MGRNRSSKLLIATAGLAMAVVGIGAAVVSSRLTRARRAGEPAASVDTGSAAARQNQSGRAKVSLDLPAGGAVTSVAYLVRSAAGDTLAQGTFAVADSSATVGLEVELPPGKAHVITFAGNASVAGWRPFLGRSTFDVAPGETTAVKAAGGELAPAPGGGALASAPVAGGGARGDSAQSCQSCQLSARRGLCDPPNLTATSNTNPDTGQESAIGWGIDTLPTAAQRDAAAALLRCLNSNDCAGGGSSPVLGCYCGAAPATACIGGQGIDGPCVREYQAAALASPGGPGRGATLAQLSQFIATAHGDPTTPFGLADNIKQCAIDGKCDACDQL